MEPGSRYLCIVQGAATKASPASLALPSKATTHSR
jgi:hypothetical protein